MQDGLTDVLARQGVEVGSLLDGWVARSPTALVLRTPELERTPSNDAMLVLDLTTFTARVTAVPPALAGDAWLGFNAAEAGTGAYRLLDVERDGGVVIAMNERRITVWYPLAAQVPPHTVSLP